MEPTPIGWLHPFGQTLHWVGLPLLPSQVSLLWECCLLLFRHLVEPSCCLLCDLLEEFHSVSCRDLSWPVSPTLLFCSSYSVTLDQTLLRSHQLHLDLSLRQSRSTCFNGEVTSWRFHSKFGRVPRASPNHWDISDNTVSTGVGYESDNDTAAFVISVSMLCSPTLASPGVAQIWQGVSETWGGASASLYA